MSSDSFDRFPYCLDTRVASEADRRRYWAVAIGLQRVDGPEVPPYLKQIVFDLLM